MSLCYYAFTGSQPAKVICYAAVCVSVDMISARGNFPRSNNFGAVGDMKTNLLDFKVDRSKVRITVRQNMVRKALFLNPQPFDSTVT